MSRESILKKVRESKPAFRPLPNINTSFLQENYDLKVEFKKNLEASAGKVVEAGNKSELNNQISRLYPEAKMIISCIDDVQLSTINVNAINSAQELEKLDLAILEAQFGVAENGAVWVTDKNFYHRSIPFIAAHLAIILKQENIVANMHDAYARLSGFDEGYGVFIAGPSKTADIEQSLVIGAQAALSLTLFLVENS